MVITDKKFDELKKKFLACEYIENSKIKVEDGKTAYENSILGIFCDRLDIKVVGRAKFFMNNNVVGFYGNKKIKSKGQSYKIFETLDLIMKKLKKI